MKKIVLSLGAIIAMSSAAVAGGKIIAPVVLPVAVIEEDKNICDFYVGGGIIYNRVYSTDSEWFNDNIGTQDETGGLAILAGCQFNEYIAVEGRYTWTEWDQDYSDMTSYSIFIKPMYPVTEDFTVYGLLGYGNSEVTGSSGDSSNHYSAWKDNIGKTMMDHSGFHWGFGVMYEVMEDLSIFADFTLTADDADIEPTTLYCYDGTPSHTGKNCTDDSDLYDKLSTDGLTVGLIYKF